MALIEVSRQNEDEVNELNHGINALQKALTISEELKVDEDEQDQIATCLEVARELFRVRMTNQAEFFDQKMLGALKKQMSTFKYLQMKQRVDKTVRIDT